jgi:hypothetical protein
MLDITPDNKLKQDTAHDLALLIRINEMLPPEMRCEDAIADMKAKLARLRRPSLKLVSPTQQINLKGGVANDAAPNNERN